MLITFQLAHEDRGRLIGKFGATINCLRRKHQCNEILIHDDNKLIINHDDNQIINNIVFDIELILHKRLMQPSLQQQHNNAQQQQQQQQLQQQHWSRNRTNRTKNRIKKRNCGGIKSGDDTSFFLY